MARGTARFEVLSICQDRSKDKKWYQPYVKNGGEDHVAC